MTHPFEGFLPSVEVTGDITAMTNLIEQEAERLDKNVIYFAGTHAEYAAMIGCIKSQHINDRQVGATYVSGSKFGPEMLYIATTALLQKYKEMIDAVIIGTDYIDQAKFIQQKGGGHVFIPAEGFISSCQEWSNTHHDDVEPKLRTGRDAFLYLRKDYSSDRTPMRPMFIVYTGNDHAVFEQWLQTFAAAVIDGPGQRPVTPKLISETSYQATKAALADFIDHCHEYDERMLPALAGASGEEFGKAFYRKGFIILFVNDLNIATDFQ